MFFVLGVHNSNQASVIPMFDSEENEIDLNFDEYSIENEIDHEQLNAFPTVDPNIDEDARLNVVNLVFCFHIIVFNHGNSTHSSSSVCFFAQYLITNFFFLGLHR